MANEKPSAAPPYVGWGVFKSTIDTLAESVVPTGALDRRVLGFLSGANHPTLISSLKFLGLVDANSIATPAFRELVRVSKEPIAFKAELKRIIDSCYAPIIGGIDLKHGTAGEIEKAFKEAGVTQGQMLSKTMRFFIKAETECGTELSPHITKPRPRVRSAAPKSSSDKKTNRTTKPNQDSISPPPAGEGDRPPEGFDRLPIPGVPQAFVQYPVNLTAEQCTLFTAAIAFLKVYVTGKIDVGKEAPK